MSKQTAGMTELAVRPPAAPEAMNTALRDRLIDATVEVVSTEGLHALTVRRVSRMCGVSTMAVYSNFGGMPGLIRAAGSAGFAQLGQRMAAAGVTDEPIADLLVLGLVFRDEARRRPELFQLMFGTGTRIDMKINRGNVLVAGHDSEFEHYQETFDHVVGAVRRAQDAGLIDTPDVRSAAAQLWMGLFGFIQLEMAGHLGDDGVLEVLVPAIVNLLVGMGAQLETVGAAVLVAMQRFTAGPGD
ncbi:TetR/AcrR family transcriptional regulator [Nocardia pneumoniae]|uniref:TetR/AcrR family transcriptional regulator n=1 Tax=Nocardia pneumoniae TaxID=228601 RepID=UPI000A053700|nr:WHG domain-containing protein [Nocardia pneumoniae]